MKLQSAASYFDNTPCYDAYTGVHLFDAQLDLYDDSKRDGQSAQRRILSLDPKFSIPAKRVIKIESDYWILGDNNPDYFQGSAIRNKYIIQRADQLARVYTPAQLLLGLSGSAIYLGRSWVKSIKQVEISSEQFSEYELIGAITETLDAGSLVKYYDDWFIVSDSVETAGGFKAGVSEQVHENLPINVVWGKRTYQPLSDTYTINGVSLNVLKLRWQSIFKYEQPAATKYKAGDSVIVVLKSDVSSVGTADTFMVGSETYAVIASFGLDQCWAIHVRNV